MSESDLLDKLRSMDLQITPGALEVIKNSHVQLNDLIAGIDRSWKDQEKVITVKGAINLILSSKHAEAKRMIRSEIKTHKKPVLIPKRLKRTYDILKNFDKPATAGSIARITHRKEKTESIYLNKLVENGFAKKEHKEGKKPRYSISG